MSIMIQESYRALLAKLLANENIEVQVKSVRTASFAPKERILVLPDWSNLDPDISDLFTGHEVGHALFTPSDFCQTTSKHFPHIPFDIFNIVEDVRIERMIQQKYPGLIFIFETAYAKLVSDNFFGISPSEINGMNFLDRLNFHEKTRLPVIFSPEEQKYVNKVEQCQSIWDVYRVSEEIFQFLKSRIEINQQKQSSTSTSAKEEAESHEEESSCDSKETDSDERSSESESNKESGDDESDSSESDSSESGDDSGCHESNDDESNDTKELTEDNKRDEFSSETLQAEMQNRGMMTVTTNIVKKFNVFRNELNPISVISNNIGEFVRKHKSKIDNLTCQFLMKQAASGYTKQSMHQTGILDEKYLHRYQFDDLIFKSRELSHREKNHGLIFLIDFSSSMSKVLQNTIEKTLILAAFCDNAKIPYRIYSFTTGSTYGCNLKLICDSTRKNNRANQNAILNWKEAGISLGGTPLVEALFSIIDDLNEFKKKTRVEIVNFILLSDGDGTTVHEGDTYSHGGKIIRIGNTCQKQQEAAVKYMTHLGYRTMCIFIDSGVHVHRMEKNHRGFQRYFYIPAMIDKQMISDPLSQKVTENKYFTFFAREFSNFIS